MTENDCDEHPAALLPLLRTSAGAVLDTAGPLTETELRAPSSLPGWSRAHVLTHLARSADSRVRLLTAARTGADLPQYPDGETREREIEEGAWRGADAVRADLEDSLRRVLDAIAHHPRDAWDVPVRWLDSGPGPVRDVPGTLLRELEMHHVDLALGHTPEDWPDRFVAVETRGVVELLREERDVPNMRLRADEDRVVHSLGERTGPLVTGPAAALLAWLTGRSDGSGLTVEPPGPLPTVPAWKQ
ncbi:maleylpyruvate isomerase family mycothiol-dependent enzyme [Streptomyces sp. AM 4-1-1]|uniref:maleylpyruvate isomerase family mycothiol-dependent enzyme n=1 Tax=Streptomyces sp. AM 4-1-1 TaxID=3028710 RepID=UPI0023B896B7|nr:maleylpyruvate isomerase family mycothiol-dependent enzyme [Streptomyces sp. AM 4-1-1]WEH34719.1 maleylpyruvate isomerase family mycothiol-dependent enzyme [Streptomyces sp. AM 4-1-1]